MWFLLLSRLSFRLLSHVFLVVPFGRYIDGTQISADLIVDRVGVIEGLGLLFVIGEYVFVGSSFPSSSFIHPCILKILFLKRTVHCF